MNVQKKAMFVKVFHYIVMFEGCFAGLNICFWRRHKVQKQIC